MSRKRKEANPAPRQPDSTSRITGIVSHRWFSAWLGGLYLVVVVAIGLKFHVMVDGDSETDFIGSYVQQARSFLGGTIAIDPYRGPLYPIAIATLSVPLRLFGLGLLETGIILSALSAALIVFLVHRLVKRLFGPSIAVAATLLVVVNSVFFRYSYTTGNDMFFAALATWVVYLILATDELNWKRLIGASVIAGLAYLTRYNGIAVVLGAVACILFIRSWGRSWRRRLLGALAFIVSFFVVITPWGLYTLSERGAFQYNKNYVNMAMSFHVGDETPERFRAAHGNEFNSFADVVAWDPVGFFSKIPRFAWTNFVRSLERVTLPLAGFFCVIGILFSIVRRPTRGQTAYYTFGILFFAVLSVVFYNDRFLLFLIPMFMVLAAQGVHVAGRFFRAQRSRQIAFVALTLVVGIYGCANSIAYNRVLLPGGELAFRLMGEKFRAEHPGQEGKRVVERKPFFSYFAGLEHVPMPVVDSVDDMMDHLYESNADYLFFSFIAVRTRPPAAELVDPRVPRPGLKFVANSEIGTLYEVLPAATQRIR